MLWPRVATGRAAGRAPSFPRLPALALVLFLVLVLTAGACASSPVAARSVTLHVLMTDDWVTAPYIAAVREFEATHPGVMVSTDKLPIDLMSSTLRADVAKGNPPDVAQYHAFAAGAQGTAESIDDLWKGTLDPSEFLPGAVEDVTWAGHRYGVPLDSNALMLLYNAPEFAAAKVAPPGVTTTLADLDRLGAQMTTADGSHRAVSMATSDWWTYGWIKAAGGEVLTSGPDGKPVVTLDAPAVVKAVTFLDDLATHNYAFAPRTSASSSSDALALFQNGAAAMYATGSWDLGSLTTGTYAVAPLPRASTSEPESTVLGGSSLLIPKGAKNRTLAFQFMVLLTSDTYALQFAAQDGRLPVRPRLFSNALFQNPNLQAFVQNLSSAHPYTLEAYAPAKAAFQQALDAIFLDGAAPATALAQAQATAVAALGASP